MSSSIIPSNTVESAVNVSLSMSMFGGEWVSCVPLDGCNEVTANGG